MIGRKFGPAVHPRSALFRGTCVATCVTATAQRQRGSAVFVLLRGAAANAAGALDDAIAYDRSTADSLAEGAVCCELVSAGGGSLLISGISKRCFGLDLAPTPPVSL